MIDTNNEANKLNVIASANGLNISPTDPDTNANGKNTIIVTNVEDSIGLNTSVVAFMINESPLSCSFYQINVYIYSQPQR